jgi:glycosyl-4,4'-diaponeurosporenoate acyltransferase
VPIELPVPWVIALNALGLPALQLGFAWAFTRMPAAWFHPPSSGKDRRHFYEHVLKIKRWKDLLPDGASWFKGGFAKASLHRRDPQHLRDFHRETWRGELCHWMVLAFIPLFFLWNPWWGDLVIALYALAANLPCILVQRYNRRRLGRASGIGAKVSRALR